MADQGKEKEVDKLTGVETTGHEWDGLKELNNPAPRWWLLVFLICCVWAVGYWVVYPAWPTISGHTKGMGGHTQYRELEAGQAEIRLRQAGYNELFEKASLSEIMNDPSLYTYAVAGGAAAFKDNCATCHGTGGAGGKGYPNLNDDDWLWGGTVDDIYRTIRFGIRSPHEDTRVSQMLAFGRDGMLTKEQISEVASFVVSLSEKGMDETAPGYKIFQENCASCHGADAKGGREFGAPNLTDAIWLYGGDRKTVYETIYNGRGGIMPNWNTRLDDDTIRRLSVYVHSLGGGE